MVVENTPAYYDTATIMSVKIFIVQAPEVTDRDQKWESEGKRVRK
jgi:hypothetical protein